MMKSFPASLFPVKVNLWQINKLQPISRLIGRILVYNICPKTESYNYYYRDLASRVYAIMAGLEVN